MKKYGWIGLSLALILTLGTAGCTNDTLPDGGTQTEGSGDNTTDNTIVTEPSDSFSDVPEQWHIFEYDGVKYDFWDISGLVNGVSEWRHIGKYVIAEGHVNPNMCVYAVIDTETQTVVHHFSGTTPTYHSDDINTIVYAHRNSVVAYDGTVLAELTLRAGEYIYNLAYTEDRIHIEATISGIGDPRTEIVDLGFFDAESFFGSIPAEWSQRLFWHQIRGTNDYIYFCNYRGVNSTLDGYKKDPPKRFSVYHVNSENLDVIGYIGAEIPSDITYDTVCPVVVYDGAGSMECEFIVQLTDGDTVFYVSFDNFDWGENQDHLTFTCRGVLTEERVNELKVLYPNAFRKAKQYFWYYTLDDFKNENPGDSIVYEGYTVKYEVPYPYNEGETFSFHIHLPQVNADSIYVDRWNLMLKSEYEAEFGEYLRSTAYGTNMDFRANVTFETVTTGDVITIYIINANGILQSGAGGCSYDIYHYDTVEKKFLSTDEFIAYYAEGYFADRTVADIVNFMNENVFTTDELGAPYPLTVENIQGVIPSVFGDGKFDVVYQGYVREGSYATRMLCYPYPIHQTKSVTTNASASFTYRLIYPEYSDCPDKERYGQPKGYKLVIREYGEGYDTGYSPDCLFLEDIAVPPEDHVGEYYVPINTDSDGRMYMVIDHETDQGHLKAWIPFGYPKTAQDYYRGVLYKYFSYDRILDGDYPVKKDIAARVAEVLNAYRDGKDPNELFPASKTEYTPYPLKTVRDNPDTDEIGRALKNATVDEDGIILFHIDLGDGWVMSLPMAIGGFGESWQAYFTGVYFAHSTPTIQND